MSLDPSLAHRAPWRNQLYVIIFESDTKLGRAFDITLLWTILLSVLCVSLESVSSFPPQLRESLQWLEWVLTILFTIEYILRLVSAPSARAYATSFFGLIDLFSVVPAYISFMVTGYHGLLVIRSIRLLRVFRIMKMVRYSGEAEILARALIASRRKITVFIGSVIALIVIMGAMMYLIEGPESGFTDIPTSMYWAIVTLTTVGYGDITPQTPAGKIMASLIMLTGYGILAVPTGIVSVEIGRATRSQESNRPCPRCKESNITVQSNYCWRCGERLFTPPQ